MQKQHIKHYFALPAAIAAIAVVAAAIWGYAKSDSLAVALQAFLTAIILAVVEVSLSFDNAVVNAGVLRNWNSFWRTVFLTVGILVAVFGMRLLFPLLIVSFSTGLSLPESWNLALADPDRYAEILRENHHRTAAFGGVFLFLVFLNYFIDHEKEVHWIAWLERRLGWLGRVDSAAVTITILALIAAASASGAKEGEMMVAGAYGIVTYLGVSAVARLLESEESDPAVGKMLTGGGVAGFLYLELLDASFSFDGVIGAFAITDDIVLIMIGLGIGAMFVRSLTVYMVEHGTLDEYVYLEHGAHYAIGLLGGIMLISATVHIPEIVIGILSTAAILLAMRDSIRARDRGIPA